MHSAEVGIEVVVGKDRKWIGKPVRHRGGIAHEMRKGLYMRSVDNLDKEGKMIHLIYTHMRKLRPADVTCKGLRARIA